MSWFAAKMFMSSVYSDVPVKKQNKKKKKAKKTSEGSGQHLPIDSTSVLEKKMARGESLTGGLAVEDVKSLTDEVKKIKHSSTSLWKTLCCHISFFCKQDRESRIRQKAYETFDGQLDVRSFVSVNTNLAILLWLLLSKEQMLLFSHHHDRSVTLENKSSKKNKK